ncbi:MAG: hypothetical protein H0U95_06605 [Bacteroidetes bacterium]|nr:hypothetical protein [Bacteroidota bacterium]
MESDEIINQIKFIYILIFIFLINTHSNAQTKTKPLTYFTLGYNLGYFGLTPSSHQSISGKGFTRTLGVVAGNNGRGGFTFTGTTSLGVNMGFCRQNKRNKNMWGIIADLQQNRNSYIFDMPFKKKVPQRGGDQDADDPYLGDSTEVSTGKWIETDKYLKLAVGIQHLWYIRKEADLMNGEKYGYFKVSLGQSFMHRNQGRSVVDVGQTDSGSDELGNVINATTIVANRTPYVLSSEIGVCSFSPNKDRSLKFALAWHLPLTSSYTREYEFLKKIPGNTHQPTTMQFFGKEDITFQGGSFLLNVTYNFNSKIHSKPIDTLKIWQKMHEPASPMIVHNHKPHFINGRKVKIKNKIELNDSVVVAYVWDKGKIDGDRITLYLNGKEILQDYTVAKAKRQIVLHLNPGKNYLVMHALNLGRIPPNTAAIEINDGRKSKQMILNSDTKKSGALELDCIPG